LDHSKWRHPLAPDSLFQIAWAIQRGERPRREDLIAALDRDERVIWPEGVLPYVASLLAGKTGRRKPSLWQEEQKIYEAYDLVRRVERWGNYFRKRKKLRGWRKAALEKVAEERNWSWNNIEKSYKQAKKLLKTVRIATTDWKLKRIIAGYRRRPPSGGTQKI
jgi:hypothetical protein